MPGDRAITHIRRSRFAAAVTVIACTFVVATLRAADVQVSATRMLMPLAATVKHVDSALSLLKEHKYYEANLALKAAEDGLITDTVLLTEPTKTTPEKKKEEKKAPQRTHHGWSRVAR